VTVSELIQALQNLGPESQDREIRVFVSHPHQEPQTAVIEEVYLDGSVPLIDWDVNSIEGV
jgi:hypothetical protein